MKTEPELHRAMRLLTLLLSNQVKLNRPLPPAAILNVQGIIRALQWTLNLPENFPLDEFLSRIENETRDPGFNPHLTITE